MADLGLLRANGTYLAEYPIFQFLLSDFPDLSVGTVGISFANLCTEKMKSSEIDLKMVKNFQSTVLFMVVLGAIRDLCTEQHISF